MKNLSELFEFLSFCENETILKEVKNHGERLIRLNGSKAAPKLKLDIEKLNTLFRLSEWFLNDEFHSDMKDVVFAQEGDEIMTVKEAAKLKKSFPPTSHRLKNMTISGYWLLTDWHGQTKSAEGGQKVRLSQSRITGRL